MLPAYYITYDLNFMLQKYWKRRQNIAKLII